MVASADSGEISIAEVFGTTSARNGATMRVGNKAHHEPWLTTDVHDVLVQIDATQPYTHGGECGAPT